MHRTDAAGNVGGFFTDGDPGVPTPATRVDDDWLNAVQEEIIAVLAQASIAPVKGINTQLRDAILSLVSGAPIGTVRIWAGLASAVPSGHLLCDGAEVLRAGTYAALFAVLGTRFGAGNGTTTFNLPNLKQRYPLGANNDGELGTTVGANSVTATMQTAGSHNHGGTVGGTAITIAQMPAHTHTYDALVTTSSHETGTGASEARGQVTNQATASQGGGQTHNHTISTESAHSHTMNAQDNRPASLILHYIIRSN